jgi:hypothetical protein
MSSLLSAADEAFHPGATKDRSWTETAWFAGVVPQRGIGVWTYPLFRHELGVMSCGIYVWEPGAEELWQLPYYRTWWHMAIPEGISATTFTLPNGLRYECVEPERRYRVTYADGDAIALELNFDAIHPPHPVGVVPGSHGHLDQLGRVTGELTLHGERHELSGIEMRDRTWSPRRESRQRAFVTYSYGTSSESSGFHVSTRYKPDLGRNDLLTGFLLENGVTVALDSGTCAVERDEQGRPVRVHVNAHTADSDRELDVHGEVVSRLSMPSTPWFVWACIVLWTLPDGSQAMGEHQDTWGPGALRQRLGATGASAPA